MVRVDVSRNLEHKTCEFFFIRIHFTLFCLRRTRTGSNFHKSIEQFLHTKVVQCRTKEDWCQLAFEIFCCFKFRINTLQQLQLATQTVGQISTYLIVQFLGVDIDSNLFGHHLLRRLEQVEVVFVKVINTFETLTAFNGPRKGTNMNLQFFLQLVQQIKRILRFTVHFVNKNDDGCLAHTANLHQLACLSFHTLGSINHNYNRIHSRKRTVGVFSKILVTGSVENVDFIVMVIKLHHRSCH